LFKNVPKNRIQAGRGSARKRDSKVGSMMFMAKKRACWPFGEQAGKILVWVWLGLFLLLAGVTDLKGGLPGGTGDAQGHPHGPVFACVRINCARQSHLPRETMPSSLAGVKRPFLDLRHASVTEGKCRARLWASRDISPRNRFSARRSLALPTMIDALLSPRFLGHRSGNSGSGGVAPSREQTYRAI